ncbi:transcriptional regulator, TetR family [Desulfuromonas soudanensis]|uniref:Transcriptional regulator, TetR family n=1 Tax=Desulfuromonas soudanensis TaxID=1603606 RepID=A0A0M4DGE0_9BACT|nr:TetR/AcrR family transcriptional regulator [Desulfuromonas soudanensis]ALC15682.1 transcriptional regulator, TetR family [Desulfuromonas soudanensis]
MSSKKEEKRMALLNAALELFAERGFNGSSTALIAKRAGVASGTLFFHFTSKEELIHALFKEVRSKIDSRVLENFPGSMALRERLLRILSNLLRYFLEHPAEFKFVEQYHFSPFSERGGSFRDENEAIRNLLLLARKEGIVKDVPLLCLEAVAFGPISSLVKEHANRRTSIDDEIIRLTIDACWDGLKRQDE